VHMVHTTLSKPSHIQELNYDVAPPREVATISNYTIPANTRGFVDIPFNPGAVFPYNGRDNLLIEIEGFGSTGLYYWNIGRRPEVRRTWAFAGGNVGKDIVFPAIEVSFQETDTDDSYSVVMAAVFDLNRNGPCEPPGCIPPAVDKVLPATGSRIQVLLLSREISGTGMVKGVAWKPPSATSSVGATYQDLSVSVGNLFLNTMSPTFVSTLTQVRAPAPYTVPAGETGFIPIPLDLPLSFLYDGTQNLVVEITTVSGTALNSVDSMNISPEQRLVTAGVPGAASGSVVADMISMRLEFD
ncbi:MAG: hypothetical protein O6952_02980, partial [Planctomycetota bacterium]|nr:hypothetical protein [Planctomycetota bacterium]